ncbi:MAG: hypothetical protein RI918_1575 [Pseudomonadota bacterium]|jgi:hypothetical protein
MIVQIVLPGEQRKTAPDIGDYRITVERLDGIACTEIEAKTAMAMCTIQRTKNKRVTKTPQGKLDV